MFKISQEEVKEPFYVKHVTQNKYKYPKINLDDEVEGGFGSNAYGYGFYTSNNPEVIKGYVNAKNTPDTYVRKQKIPAGAKYLYLKEIPTNFIKDWIISNNLTSIFNLNDNTTNLASRYDLLSKYNFSKYARDKGIDLLKYDAFELIYANKNNSEGFNWLIINPDILNIKDDGENEHSFESEERENDYFKSIIKSHPQKREILFYKHWKDLKPDQIYFLLDKNIIKFKWVTKTGAVHRLNSEKMKDLSYKYNIPLNIKYYSDKELINLCKFKVGYYYEHSDEINGRLSPQQIIDIYFNTKDKIILEYFPISIYNKIVKNQLTKTISDFDNLHGWKKSEMQKAISNFILENKEFINKNPKVASRIMVHFTDLIPQVVNINPEFIIYMPYRMDGLLANLINKYKKYYTRNPKPIQYLLYANNIDPTIVYDLLPTAFNKFIKYRPEIQDEVQNYDINLDEYDSDHDDYDYRYLDEEE